MKKLLILLISMCILYGCEYEEVTPLDLHTYNLTITGDCQVISINLELYYGLQYGIEYEDASSIFGDTVDNWFYVIKKETADASIVSAVLTVDGVEVYNDTTTAPYGQLIIEYEVQ